MRPALVAALADAHPHLVGVNCSHADVGHLVGLVDAVGGRLEIHVGGPMQALTALSLGAQGFLSSEANLAPQLCASVVRGFNADDLTATFGAFGEVVRLSGLLYGLGGIRATKAVLDHLGLPGGTVRRPQLPVEDTTVARIVAHLQAAGIPEIEGWD